MKGTALILKMVISITLILSGTALAQEIIYSPDITADLSGTILYDEEVAEDDLAGNVMLIDAGPIPESTDVTAYHLLPNGDQLLAFDTTVVLNGITFEPGDVARYDWTAYSVEFDASAEGVPSGVYVDAVTMEGNVMVLSFDTTVSLSGLTVEDEDLVAFNGVDFALFFDGSTAGVDEALDLDAAYLLAGKLLLSFDGSGSVDSVPFDDEDVLEYDPSANTWTLFYDGSSHHAGWTTADLDALSSIVVNIPATTEGGILIFMVLAGLTAVYYLRRRRIAH